MISSKESYDPVFFSLEEIHSDVKQDTTFTLYNDCKLDLQEEEEDNQPEIPIQNPVKAKPTQQSAEIFLHFIEKCYGVVFKSPSAYLYRLTKHSVNSIKDCVTELALFSYDRIQYNARKSKLLAGSDFDRAFDDLLDLDQESVLEFLRNGYTACGRNIGLLSLTDRLALLRDHELPDPNTSYVTVVSTPPDFYLGSSCRFCEEKFSICKFRHHCRNCGGSVCSDCSPYRSRLPHFGYELPVRVCKVCFQLLVEETQRQLLYWRFLRIRAYLAGTLKVYPSIVQDKPMDKIHRLMRITLEVARGALSLTLPSRMLLESTEMLYQHGWTGLAGIALRADFIEALTILIQAAGMSDFDMSLGDLTACVYYKLAIDRGNRGRFPKQEHLDHIKEAHHLLKRESVLTLGDQLKSAPQSRSRSGTFASDVVEVPDNQLDTAIRFAPLALVAVYQEKISDVQRIAASQEWITLWARLESSPEQPSYAVFASSLGGKNPKTAYQAYLAKNSSSTSKSNAKNEPKRREVVLCIRGTKSIEDVITDIRTSLEAFPPVPELVEAAWSGIFRSTPENSPTNLSNNDVKKGQEEHPCQSMACRGVGRAAVWMLSSVGQALLHFHNEGYDIIICGHSLGGAVAALLVQLVKEKIPGVKGWTYGCPPVVDQQIADDLQNCLTTVVLRDDVISRITPRSIRVFLRNLVCSKDEVRKHLSKDWAAVCHRIGTLWRPRLRSMPVVKSSEKDTGSSQALVVPPKYCDNFSHSDDEVEVNGYVLLDPPASACHYLPGKVIHIYVLSGRYHAAVVSKSFPPLQRIDIQGNMFDDHRAKNIFEAMLEVRTVRNTKRQALDWQPFDSAEFCSCCHNQFSWHSTFRSEAQGFRDKHNCRMCARLCCGPCSTKRSAIPSIGLARPVRICESCFYAGNYMDVQAASRE